MGCSASDGVSSGGEHPCSAQPPAPRTTSNRSSESQGGPGKRVVVRGRFTYRFCTAAFTVFLLAMLYEGITAPAPAAIVVGALGAALLVPMTVDAFRSKVVLDGPVLSRIDARGRPHPVRLDLLRSVDCHHVGTYSYAELILLLHDQSGREVTLGSMRFRVRGMLRLIAPWCRDNPDVTVDPATRRKIDAAERGRWWLPAWWSRHRHRLKPGGR